MSPEAEAALVELVRALTVWTRVSLQKQGLDDAFRSLGEFQETFEAALAKKPIDHEHNIEPRWD